MGQIVSAAAKPKRCNLNQLSQVPTPAAGEHILVSSDNSMNAAGQGNFDCYIVGDGKTAATALELKSIADSTLVDDSKNSVSGLAVYSALKNRAVMNEYQSLSSSKKQQARENIGINDYTEVSVDEGEKCIIIANDNDEEVLKISEDGTIYKLQDSKRELKGQTILGKYISGAGNITDSSALTYTILDVEDIDSVYIETYIGNSTGIRVWYGLYNGSVVSRGNIYSTGNELRQEIVDTTNFDTLYINGQVSGITQAFELFDNELTEKAESKNLGLFIGDSLMMGVGAPVGFDAVEYAKKYLLCDALNGGIGGICMHNDTRDANLYQLVTAFETGDWTSINRFIQNYVVTPTGVGSDIQRRYAEIEATPFEYYSFLLISLGTNDLTSGATLDNPNNEEDVTTILGSLRYAIRKFLALSPYLRIYVATPPYRKDVPSGATMTISELCDGIVSACAALGVPCLNQLANGSVNTNNANYYLIDNAHRNAAGYKLMGDLYAKFISNY